MIRILSVLTVVLFIFILIASFAFAVSKGQNIVKLYSDTEITEDMVVNDVVSIGGSATISGRVEGDVVILGGSATLKNGAYIGDQVVVVGGSLFRDPGAVINGRVTQVYMPDFIPSLAGLVKGGWVAMWAIISVFVLLGFLGLAILLISLIPEHMGAVVNVLQKTFLVSFLWGVFWMILIIPIALLLLVSIVGIVLIPLEILLAALAFVLGYIASAVFIGRKVALSFKKTLPPFVDAIFGIIILFFVGFIPIIGPVVKSVFVIAGFGAVITTRFGIIK